MTDLTSPLTFPSTATDSADQTSLNRLTEDHLDRLLMQYARRGDVFTICEIRDQLLKEPELSQICPKALRFRVRDRVNLLLRQDLATEVGVQGKRRRVFKLDFDETGVDDSSEATETPFPSSITADSEAPGTFPASDEPPTPFLDYLNSERQRLKMDMQAALGEARHYQQILSQFPEQKTRIEPLHQAALERGGELKGALDAVIALYRSVSQEVDS